MSKLITEKWKSNNFFLRFFPLKGKKASDLSSEIFANLESDGLDIMMCRCQGYDHAAVMSGVHGGVQVIIKSKNEKALFNGCVNNLVNLCGVHSFAENALCVLFFGTLEQIFAFFSASTHRRDVLLNHCDCSVKRLSTTRWSAHYAAVKAVEENFDKVIAAIEELCDPQENVDTRGSAQSLLPAVCNFTFLCFLYFWKEVLKEIDCTQVYLQTKALSPRFRRHFKATKVDLLVANHWNALDFLNFIVKWDFVKSLPNLTLSLKLLLTICVSNAGCERSFSKLKLIKDYLRSTMSQTRLNDLAILSIEKQTSENMDFDDITNNSAAIKARREKFN